MNKYSAYQEPAETIRFQGRVLRDRDMVVMGYTNSCFTLHVSASCVRAVLRTGENDPINAPGLRVYVDDIATREIILSGTETDVLLAEFPKKEEHVIRVVKITEAAMSFVGVVSIDVDGELLAVPEDTRTKALFIDHLRIWCPRCAGSGIYHP